MIAIIVGIGLLPFTGNYAPRCQASQCYDRPWA